MKIDNGNYFEANNIKLFYLVIGELKGASQCLLYLSPLFEERMWGQRVAFTFAKEFNRITGKPVVMMDYYGYGESDGDTEDFSLKRSKEHFHMLMKYLRKEFGIASFALWGVRGGCLLATMLEKTEVQCCSLLLWAPILNLKKHIYTQLRSTVATQGTIFKKVKATRDEILNELLSTGKCERDGYQMNHVDGYRIGKNFWMEISASDSLCDYRKAQIPILAIDIISTRDAERMAGKTVEQIKNNVRCERVAANKFWQENLEYSQFSKKVFELSIAWFCDVMK